MAKKKTAELDTRPLEAAVMLDPANPPAPESGVEVPGPDMVKLELLPGILVECIPDPRWETEWIADVDWPCMFAGPPMVGDFVNSTDGTRTARVTARGHRIGPLGPYLVVNLGPFVD